MKNSIEKDIARIAKLITTKFNNDYSIDNKDKEAIEHILSNYKKVLKENEKLSEYYKEQNEVNAKFIPVQKVKDKIEEIDERLKYEENEKVVIYLHKQRKVLKELLEKENKIK